MSSRATSRKFWYVTSGCTGHNRSRLVTSGYSWLLAVASGCKQPLRSLLAASWIRVMTYPHSSLKLSLASLAREALENPQCVSFPWANGPPPARPARLPRVPTGQNRGGGRRPTPLGPASSQVAIRCAAAGAGQLRRQRAQARHSQGGQRECPRRTTRPATTAARPATASPPPAAYLCCPRRATPPCPAPAKAARAALTTCTPPLLKSRCTRSLGCTRSTTPDEIGLPHLMI